MSEGRSKQPSEPRIPVYLSMDDPEPMYRQIESQLKDFILAGVLPPGTKLPSIRALAVDLACSVITTRRAYENLEAEGFVRTRQGMGTLVAEISEEKMRAHRREAVEVAFREAIKAGRRASLTEEELREILEDVLHREDPQTDIASTREVTPKV
jgi:GntR family transcriptional regulator